MYYFTGDEHHGHENIIKFQNRPFKDTEHMKDEMIWRHNKVVKPEDTVIHLGDFAMGLSLNDVGIIMGKLNGINIFLKGSHDKWQKKLDDYFKGKIAFPYIWESMIEDKYVVCCHYAMLTWPRSHYGSWQLFGHSHGHLTTHNPDRQYDVGVDSNEFYPVSFEKLKTILK